MANNPVETGGNWDGKRKRTLVLIEPVAYINGNKFFDSSLKDIHATPTILFDGYKLPDKYKVADLLHFKDMDI